MDNSISDASLFTLLGTLFTLFIEYSFSNFYFDLQIEPMIGNPTSY